MRTVRLYMTMTCDGCFAGPGGELDWMTGAADPEMNRDVVDLIGQADTAFMGYPTASGMIPYWRQAAANPAASAAEHAIADAVNRVRSLQALPLRRDTPDLPAPVTGTVAWALRTAALDASLPDGMTSSGLGRRCR